MGLDEDKLISYMVSHYEREGWFPQAFEWNYGGVYYTTPDDVNLCMNKMQEEENHEQQ